MCGSMSVIGCTSAVVPFIDECVCVFGGRGPLVRARLYQERGLLEEDLQEVDGVLEGLMEQVGDGGGGRG